MPVFAKSAWAILGITPDSHDAFLKTVNSLPGMYALSQAFSLATMRNDEKHVAMVGINPFGNPRKDEQGDPLGKDFEAAVVLDTDVFGKGEEEFRLTPAYPWYGFWMIFNEAEDVDDIKSKQEQFAYSESSRPFKFLNKDQKKVVVEMAKPLNVGTRKQFPVLLDFQAGRVYIASTNKDEIATVRSTLEDMGVKVHGLAWDFGDADWVEHFLNKVNEKNKFVKEMQTRADEIRRGLDIEPLEDKVTENIIKNFFALAELDSGQWVGLYPNVAIKLYGGGQPVTVSDPSDAFNLLQVAEEFNWGAKVYQSGVVFQELDSKFNRKGEEKFTRTNLFSFDLNQNWALLDEEVALVRGFDIPNFKKEILKNIRKTKTEQPIAFYYSEWLRQMNLGIYTLADNVNLTLGVNGGLVALEQMNAGVETPIETQGTT
jgi:hypothetical protein